MTTLLLILSIGMFILQSVSMKFIKAKTLPDKLFVNAIFTLIAGIGMSLYLVNDPTPFTLSGTTFFFGCIFGFLFAFTILFYNLAISSGPLSYTAFYFSSSMLLPTIAGLIFFNEEMNAFLIIAILLFLVAFYFLNVPTNKKEANDSNPSVKTNASSKKTWLIFCTLSFLGNGSLSIVQKFQQFLSNGTEASGMIVTGFYVASLCYFISYLILNATKKTSRPSTLIKENKVSIVLLATGSLCGNLLLTRLAGMMPSSYLFPLVHGSIILGITLISTAFFHEKLSPQGKFGILLGVMAVVFINL